MRLFQTPGKRLVSLVDEAKPDVQAAAQAHQRAAEAVEYAAYALLAMVAAYLSFKMMRAFDGRP